MKRLRGSRQASEMRQAGIKRTNKYKKKRREHIYSGNNHYTLVWKWHTPKNVQLLNVTKKGGCNGN